MEVEIVEGDRAASFVVNVGHPIVTNGYWGLCGVVILCREGWRRGSSQIILGFLVSIVPVKTGG